jgi:hypothetical protein
MPAATTHNEFSKDLYRSLPNNIKNNITNIQMFNLGNQGPDVFFHDYMGLTPNSYMKLGEKLHHDKILEIVKSLYKYSKDDEDLYSYFYGYLGHYSLDSLIHPLVYYNVEVLLNSNKDQEVVNHFKCESVIDVHILNKQGLTIRDFCVDKDIKLNKKEADKIGDLYKNVFKDVFDIDLKSKQISDAARRMSLFMSWLKPNSKFKFKLVKFIESSFRRKHFISALGLYNKLDIDVLNDNKKMFYNVKNKKITSNLTFDELYNNAIDDCIKRMNDIDNKDFYKVDFNGNS